MALNVRDDVLFWGPHQAYGAKPLKIVPFIPMLPNYSQGSTKGAGLGNFVRC
jgi:hypothetical protein